MLKLVHAQAFVLYMSTHAFLVACSCRRRIKILVLITQAIKVKIWCVGELEAKTLAAPSMVSEIVVKVSAILSVLVINLTKTFLLLNISPLLIFRVVVVVIIQIILRYPMVMLVVINPHRPTTL